jgi:Na+/phosphate symporter
MYSKEKFVKIVQNLKDNFLNKNMTKDEIKREIKLMAKIDDIEEISDMLLRGYAEIKQYIHDKADDNIKGLFTCQLQ